MLSKPHFILWLGMLVFALIGFFSDSLSAIDIQLHDTYFVIAYSHLWFFFSIFLGFLGLIYWLMDWFGIKLWIVLSFLHISTTYLVFLSFTFFYIFILIQPQRYYSVHNSYFTDNLFVLVSVFLLGQILFLVNLIIGIVRKLFN